MPWGFFYAFQEFAIDSTGNAMPSPNPLVSPPPIPHQKIDKKPSPCPENTQRPSNSKKTTKG